MESRRSAGGKRRPRTTAAPPVPRPGTRARGSRWGGPARSMFARTRSCGQPGKNFVKRLGDEHAGFAQRADFPANGSASAFDDDRRVAEAHALELIDESPGQERVDAQTR